MSASSEIVAQAGRRRQTVDDQHEEDPVYKSPDVQHVFPAAFLMMEKIEPMLESTKLRAGSKTAHQFTWI
ncbi:hypothetical protein ABFA07_008168 [Porites harrisoni]